MKNKKIKILINLLTICLCLLMMFSTKVQANDINHWIQEGNNFISDGKSQSKIGTDEIKNTVMPIAQGLVAIATVVLVIVTLIMGIKYMMAKDDASERAKLKTQLIGLVVATIVVFGAQIIWSTLYNFMNNLTK